MRNRETSTNAQIGERMAAIALTESSVVAVKNSLQDEFLDAKSSHITEALAYSLGFNTNAALRVALVAPDCDPPYRLLNTGRMRERMCEFGYPDEPEFNFEWLMGSPTEVISTVPTSAYEIDYRTVRQKAWRNLMVCAVNAALEQKLFTLRPGDNRFPDNMRRGELFEFVLPNGLSARGSIADAGFDELSVHAAVNPKGDAVRAYGAGFDAGDAFGTTWVERRRGVWLQSCDDSFNCRKSLLGELADLQVEPLGYGDRGHIIM